MSTLTTCQRSARGPLCIIDCDVQGKYVVIQNTGRKEMSLTNWTIKRSINGIETVQFNFPECSLHRGGRIKVYALEDKSQAGAADFVAQFPNWCIGDHISTKLFNPEDQMRASHISRTS